jgi:hypothetical protein
MVGDAKTMPLDGLTVGISGAVPDLEERAKERRSEAEIHDAVGRLVLRVLEAGGNIVYGSHPTFTDVIDGVAAGLQPKLQPGRIRMYVGRRYYYPQPESDDPEERSPLLSSAEYEAKHGRFAEIKWVGGQHEERQKTLDELRRLFITDAGALVCIGGKGPRQGKTPGVGQEANLAVSKSKPIFLIGRLGGYTRTLYEEWQRNGMLQTYLGSNRLTDAENAKLVAPAPPSELVPASDKGEPLTQPSRITTTDVIDIVLKGLSLINNG